MAKDADDVGSSRADLKKLLRLAQDTPVHMAFALGEDGKAILKLDKMKPPRSLEKTLKDGAKGARNHRFGTVSIDPANPKLVKFIVNKEVGGFARKLVLALKGTGFSKVQLLTEDGAPLEDAAGEDEEDTGDAGATSAASPIPSSETAPAPSRRAPPPNATAPDVTAPDVTANAAPDVPERGNAPDASELTRSLSGLVKQMLGVIAQAPAQKAVLTQLATDAQANLKRGDLDQAAAGIEILRQALADAGDGQDSSASTSSQTGGDSLGADGPDADASSPAAPSPRGGAKPATEQALRKSRVAWTATRAKVDAELNKLSRAILQASEGEALANDLENQFYAAVDPVLSTLDDSLADVLGQAADADGADRQQLLAQARDTIDRYAAFVESNEVIKGLDSNPFLPLAIGKTLKGTLSTLAGIMR